MCILIMHAIIKHSIACASAGLSGCGAVWTDLLAFMLQIPTWPDGPVTCCPFLVLAQIEFDTHAA
jgi:hypothetical protein